MKLTCQDADALIDLFAAEECSAEEAAALTAHVERCPACAKNLQVAREMLTLLDWHSREEAARQRLRDAIDQQNRPRLPGWFAPSTRGLGALAALVLVLLGLVVGVFSPPREPEPVAWARLTPADLEHGALPERLAPGAVRNHLPRKADLAISAPIEVPFALQNRLGQAVRLDLRRGSSEWKLALDGAGEVLSAGTLTPAELHLRPGETGRVVLRDLLLSPPGRQEFRLSLDLVGQTTREPAQPIRLRVRLAPITVQVPVTGPD